MPYLSDAILNAYRQNTFHSGPAKRIHTLEEAVNFVNRRGFIFFWPIQGVTLPSLWTAVAGDRPVADQHDDPGHITWEWKDHLLGKKVWYYARVLCRRNTIISLQLLPYFYALSPNFGDPEQDYLDQYRSGTLTLEAKLVYEALLREGPLDTLSLRKAARLSGPESTSRFNRALDTLQMELKILPVGVAQAGAWRYAFVYDLVHRHFPELIELARPISERDARSQILFKYFESVGAASLSQLQRLLRWERNELQKTLDQFVHEHLLIPHVEIQGQPEPAYALKAIFES